MGKKRARKTKVITTLNFGCFPGYLLFTAGYSVEAVRKHLKKQKSDPGWYRAIAQDEFNDNLGYAFRRSVVSKTGKSTDYFYVILKEPFDWEPESYIMLAHEFVHILQFYCPLIMNRDNEIEAEAYLHTHLMRQAIDRMNGK